MRGEGTANCGALLQYNNTQNIQQQINAFCTIHVAQTWRHPTQKLTPVECIPVATTVVNMVRSNLVQLNPWRMRSLWTRDTELISNSTVVSDVQEMHTSASRRCDAVSQRVPDGWIIYGDERNKFVGLLRLQLPSSWHYIALLFHHDMPWSVVRMRF